MQKQSYKLNDAVSVLIKSEEEPAVLFVHKETEISLPFTFVINRSWEENASNLVNKILDIVDFELKSLKLIKYWLPQSLNVQTDFVHHIIYTLSVQKSKTKTHEHLNQKLLKWIDVSDLKEYTLRNRFVAEYLGVTPLVGESTRQSINHTFWPMNEVGFLTNDDFILEIGENEIFITPDNTDSTHLRLLEAASIHKNVQLNIYREIFYQTFPNIFIKMKTFVKIVQNFSNYDTNEYYRLFQAADVYDRGFLTYKDFLYILAACDQQITHTALVGEIRCRYIFRFYDSNNDGILSYEEFREIIKNILGSNTKDAIEVAEETDRNAINIGIRPGSDMTLDQFLSAVGELRLRGTSHLLRFTKDYKEYFHGRIHEKISEIRSSSASIRLQDLKSKPMNDDKKHTIALHSLKLKKRGAIIDVDEIWSTSVMVTPSAKLEILADSKLKQSSIEAFCRKSDTNEVIACLKYFTKSKSVTKRMSEKSAFSWGDLSLQKFGEALLHTCEIVTKIFASESRLLDIKSPCYVLGDLHGNFADLMNFERLLWSLTPTLCPCNLLFLGDYVDRGKHSVEVVAYLFAYKVQNPNKVFLLRGNHEIREIQKMFTFYGECLKKFGDNFGNQIWAAVNNAFDNMPIAAVIDDKIFCCHGGIPPPWLCPSVNSIYSIPCPLPMPDEQSQLAWNLMWNDPIKSDWLNVNLNMELESKNGFAHNLRRGTGHLFSSNALQLFLETNGYSHVLRAHELQQSGIYVQYSSKLISLFSSSNYCGAKNDSAVILIESDKLRILRMDTPE